MRRAYKMDVYGPAPAAPDLGTITELPEGSTVGTSELFVHYSIGWDREYIIFPEEADRLADLLREAAAKVRLANAKSDRRK